MRLKRCLNRAQSCLCVQFKIEKVQNRHEFDRIVSNRHLFSETVILMIVLDNCTKVLHETMGKNDLGKFAS